MEIDYQITKICALVVVDFLPGTSVESAIHAAIDIAVKNKVTVQFTFNGSFISVDDQSKPENYIKQWYSKKT